MLLLPVFFSKVAASKQSSSVAGERTVEKKQQAQKVSLASWSQLANDMEEEVLSRYQVQKRGQVHVHRKR